MSVIDKRIKKLIKSSVLRKHRSLFVILGSAGFKKVSDLHRLLSKLNKKEINTLWCFKDKALNLGLENSSADGEDDSIVLRPHYCSYDDLNNISHQSCSLAILQDFESSNFPALQSILSTLKGGGAIIFLLPNLRNLEDLKSFDLNGENQTSRFGKRFIQSFNSCPTCMVLDDCLNVLSPASKLSDDQHVVIVPGVDETIEELKTKCVNDAVITTLLDMCLTGDQAELLFKYLDVLKKRTFHAIVSVSSAVGRGKSAALGLAIAGSLAFNYSNIFISSSCQSNVNILFQFLLKGLDALHYKEDKDYDLIESANPKFNSALIGLNVFRDHPQSVRFIFPDDVGHKLEQAELVVVDEAASIPFEKLKNLIGPYVVLMSSSTCGAGSTSPYLYDSMLDNLQRSSKHQMNAPTSLTAPSLGNSVQKITMTHPIHYAPNDCVESWNNHVFCMQSVMSSQLTFGCPETQQCRLFCVSRDVLFNGSSVAEKFLQSLISLFNQSSYVIKTEDFLKLADSPDHHVFVLLPPFANTSKKAPPEILCAILVHLEYEIPSDIVYCDSNLSEPIPKCFNDWKKKTNLSLQGIHILNIATHPCYKRMGYGLRAFQLLQEMYERKWISLEEKMEEDCDDTNRDVDAETAQSLLIHISEVKPEDVEFMCISFNLTIDVFRFWKKAGFVPSFLKTEKNSGEKLCFMLKSLTEEFELHLKKNWIAFQNYYFTLLNSHCQNLPSSFALSFLHSYKSFGSVKELTKKEVDMYLKPYHMKSLEKYCQNLQDLHSIIHIVPILSKLYFKHYFIDVHLPAVQEAILLSYGLQKRPIDLISKDLGLQGIQVHGLLNRTIRKLTNYLTNIIEKTVEQSLVTSNVRMEPISQDLDEELEEAANEVRLQEEQLRDLDVSQYAIKGSEDEWHKALFTGRKTLVSIKSVKKKVEIESPAKNENRQKFKKHIKKKR